MCLQDNHFSAVGTLANATAKMLLVLSFMLAIVIFVSSTNLIIKMLSLFDLLCRIITNKLT
jgi:hypothetical protein